MKIYISYDSYQNPTGVMLADSEEKAQIAWMGMKNYPHSVEEIDPNDDIGMYGVAFILTSTEKTAMSGDQKYLKWKRGI